MKWTQQLLLACFLFALGCNDLERTVPAQGKQMVSVKQKTGRTVLRLTDVAADLATFAVRKPIPESYAPSYLGYREILYFYDQKEDHHYYVYHYGKEEDIDSDATVRCISQWHGDTSQEDKGCYNPGTDCISRITPQRETEIICCD